MSGLEKEGLIIAKEAGAVPPHSCTWRGLRWSGRQGL